MKKAAIITFFAILTIANFNSCTPEEISTVVPTTNDLLSIAKIKTMTNTTTEHTDVEVLTFQYDDKGRIKSYEGKLNGVSDGTTTYEYPNATTVIEKYGSETNTYTLNDKGQAIKYVNSVPGSNIYEYTFESNGFMSNGETMVVENGNIVKNGTTTYEFNLTKINTIGEKNMGYGFFGNDDKNLVTKYTNGANFRIYTYEFDSKGRVSKETINYSGVNTDYNVYTYTD